MQRVCKYELFLRDLQKLLAKIGANQGIRTLRALTATKAAVGQVNQREKTAENLEKLAQLQERLRPIGRLNVMQPHHRIVIEDLEVYKMDES